MVCSLVHSLPAADRLASVAGVTVIPHRIEDSMQYRGERDRELAARVQLYIQGPALPKTFAGRSPTELLASGDWAWHDMSAAVEAPPEAMTVWSFNGKSSRWGTGQSFPMEADGIPASSIELKQPMTWISAVTFLSSDGDVRPDTLVMHVANESATPMTVTGLRLWLPKNGETWQVLWPQPVISTSASIAASDRGFIRLDIGKLPLTYAAIELQTDVGSLWTHLRIKREVFDISGGWVNDAIPNEAYLRLLQHLHVNTGQIEGINGYTDNESLYQRYPIKLFNRLWPLEKWDTDEWLSKIHAVEFLGEPQYGGGQPVSPQEVFDQLLPYRASRLPTTVTLSEERTWRWYAGLSDYPHYDAYRVVAPAADAWRQYDRWNGKRITWGAPLETIGVMCRSLRELNRPVPYAYWSQGPHHGWGGGFFNGGRSRRSPTPDELRSQAMHAIASRITSLYWFNLSIKSLLKFPDTWEPIKRIGREIRMMEPLLLEGDPYQFQQLTKPDGSPDWDLSSIVAPSAALLFANDTAYTIDPVENVFTFGPPRPAKFEFRLPVRLRDATDVFRIDADGAHDVDWSIKGEQVSINDNRTLDAIYVVANESSVRNSILQRRRSAIAHEDANPIDMTALEAIQK